MDMNKVIESLEDIKTAITEIIDTNTESYVDIFTETSTYTCTKKITSMFTSDHFSTTVDDIVIINAVLYLVYSQEDDPDIFTEIFDKRDALLVTIDIVPFLKERYAANVKKQIKSYLEYKCNGVIDFIYGQSMEIPNNIIDYLVVMTISDYEEHEAAYRLCMSSTLPEAVPFFKKYIIDNTHRDAMDFLRG